MKFLDDYPSFVYETEMEASLAAARSRALELKRADVLRKVFSLIDLTTLSHTDTPNSGRAFAEKVNAFATDFPDMPSVAAICVYPTLVADVADVLEVEDVELASVVGGFPSSQTFLPLKQAEAAMVIEAGATEVDMVISVGEMLEGNYQLIFDEIVGIKKAADPARVKVILETGSLSYEQIWIASLIAMEAGADFIKTSTGKTDPAATLEAAWIMCKAIAMFFEKNTKKVGFKAAGGIKTAANAVQYYAVVNALLGEDWLNPEWFRIGASSLANNLLTEIAALKGAPVPNPYF
ncbi:MAG: deoxyribose-phosphate aldolase [Bacteroidota bacterium]|jgi:deoxyribose-phosphate aldolase